jgi:alpha-N-acetylglucosamine transferase
VGEIFIHLFPYILVVLGNFSYHTKMEAEISPSFQVKPLRYLWENCKNGFITTKSLFQARAYRRRRLFILFMASFSVLWGILLCSRRSAFSTLRRAYINQSPYHFGVSDIHITQSPYAIAIFLGTEFDAEESDEDETDRYYVGARTLVYQLLHAPSTRLTSPISVIILATQGVRESKRQRLRLDGATVINIERLEHSVNIDVPFYHEVFDKLRAFDPATMPFEKVALLDADMVITRPLDALFQDTNTTYFPADKSSTRLPAPDLPELPDSYALAATPDIPGRNPVFPPDVDNTEGRDYFNAGIIVSSPTERLYQYYLALLGRPELFGHWLPEQDLLNLAHRWDGPMPWRQLNLSWHLMSPNEADFNAGMAILHCKYWQFGGDPCHKTAIARRWQMQGYWEGREGK